MFKQKHINTYFILIWFEHFIQANIVKIVRKAIQIHS